MRIKNKSFANEMQKQAFVNLCELQFARQMDALTNAILANPGERIITLSGPSCSGKTVTARNIARAVTRSGRRMYQISIDDFYRARADLNKEAEQSGRHPDYDSITSIDLASLEEVVRGIYDRKKVRHPVYDFETGTRSGYITFDSSKADVVLLEGIQAIYPEVTALFGDYPFVSVSINVRSDLTVGGVTFTPRELRLMRRIIRDVRTRGTSPERTLHLWNVTVIPNEEKSITPFENDAQIKIDSLMGYEPFVIRDAIIAALDTIGPECEYYQTARALIEKVEPLQSIDPDYVPAESVYSEFLGR